MSGITLKRSALAGAILALTVPALGAQQQVIVTVAAMPNPVPPGSCARIVADVRDELNRQLTLENGTPLQWDSYDYTSSNGIDFEWRSSPTGEFELCAKPGVGAANTQVTATIKGMPHNGATQVAVGGSVPASAAASPPEAAAATVPAQPYVAPPPAPAPATPAYAPQAGPSSPSGQTYAPPPPAAAPVAATPPPQVAPQPVKSGGGFFKKLGGHIKQRAAEVKAETAQNLTHAATQVVDTAFQTGSRLVASTAAEVSNTARLGIGGVGRKLMLAPQRGGVEADNLSLALGSGRAILLEMRFTPGTDVLEPPARDLVRRVAVELRQIMATTPTVQFVIEGHVDSVPNSQVLSEHRAGAVKAALVGNGVDGRRLIALGYGTSRPLDPGGPPVARVEITRVQ